MRPGPKIIRECPECNGLFKQSTIASGNTFAAQGWTDGVVVNPFLLDLPTITKCPHCTSFFWIKDSKEVGKIWRNLPEEEIRALPKKWKSAPHIKALGAEEYLEAIDSGFVFDGQELGFRLQAWRTENNDIRDGRLLNHSLAGKKNLGLLFQRLDPADDQERLVKAEIARHLGRFEEALALLNYEFSNALTDIAAFLTELATKKDSLLREIPDFSTEEDLEQTPLHDAVWNGKVLRTLRLIVGGADLEAKTLKGDTPLAWASLGGQTFISWLLLTRKTDVNIINNDRATPLHYAAIGGHSKIIQMLLKHGADVHARTKDGWTPLHSASFNGREDAVQLLVEAGAEIDARGLNSFTPLHRAVDQDWDNVVKMLLEQGADVNARTDDNRTSIDIALSREYVTGDNVLKHLILAPNVQYDPNARNKKKGETLLHKTACYNEISATQSLLLKGADPTIVDNGGSTPLHGAVWSETPKKMVGLFLEYGANIHAVDNEGHTPLHKAANYNKHEMLDVLIGHGASLDLKNNGGYTPLHLATYRNHPNIVETLLNKGADIHVKTKNGDTPLHWSAQKGHADVCRLLINRGSDLDSLNVDDDTPLHLAAFFGKREAAQTLIECGANTIWKDGDGKTPLDYAKQNDQEDVVSLLRVVAN